MTTYSLVCPFLTDDPKFAYGVEFGLLYARMRGKARRIDDYFCSENQDRILLLASRLGWQVKKVGRSKGGWFRAVMLKGPAPARQPGPASDD
jgi:hypothetical protein